MNGLSRYERRNNYQTKIGKSDFMFSFNAFIGQIETIFNSCAGSCLSKRYCIISILIKLCWRGEDRGYKPDFLGVFSSMKQ